MNNHSPQVAEWERVISLLARLTKDGRFPTLAGDVPMVELAEYTLAVIRETNGDLYVAQDRIDAALKESP